MQSTTALLALAMLAASAHGYAAPNCTVKLAGSDAMQFDLKTVTVSAACPTISIVLTHTGKLPVNAMGHNVVVSATKDLSAIAAAGITAGAAAAYVPKADARVIAATALIGGGGTTQVKFAGKRLTAGGDYSFFCTFPGHSTIMKGKLVVTK